MTHHLRSFVAAAAGLATACFHHLPPVEPLARPVTYKGQYWDFPTGMRAVFIQDLDASRVNVLVSYLAGAADEGADEGGAAHLLEHLGFRARHAGPDAPTLNERLTATGAIFNAFTDHETTDYWALVPRDELGSVLALEAQRFEDPLAGISDTEFERTKEVVIAEVRERDAAHRLSGQFQWVLEETLDGTPYGHRIAGTAEQVKALTREQVRAFWERNYR